MQETPESQPRPTGISSPTFRLPDLTHVGGVHLQVSDLRVSAGYYERVIGLRVVKEANHVVRLAARGDDRPLVTLHTVPGVTPARRGSYGLYHFAILLPDRSALGRFAADVAASDRRVAMADHSVSEALYLWDPDELGIEVYADRPRDMWQWRDGELVMTTDPLDLNNVIAAGGGLKWDGLPPGTTLGHVHLHVGSLGEAERFYSSGLGLDKTVWSYPGALFLSTGGYHHHLGTNIWSPGREPLPHQARLLEWELVVPSVEDMTAVGRSIRSAGYLLEYADDSLSVADPWGTRVRVLTGK